MATNDKTPPNHGSVDAANEIEGITLVPEQSREYCNRRQFLDYREHRERFVRWLLNLGILETLSFWPAMAIGAGASLAANGVFDTGIVTALLKLLKLLPDDNRKRASVNN